ncbi:phage major capsid protein [Paenibacillus lutimineralis]|uniref:Phage major capsid protein n=1 Tax=Paenibacillus lutimineralis TaxID=2707005 RepID=A0A3S9V4A3_9BACL|nr:phage major capsid protein [Paenibacillus lutimineralis]AZS17397.1 phage major capsid protein [Paenibacillus lutimineralis]
MKNLIELRKKLAAKQDEMRALIVTAQEEKRGFTDEEETKYTELEERAEELKKEIKLEERAQQLAMGGAATKRTIDDPLHESEFRDLGDIITTYRTKPNDPRLEEYREMAMKTSASGGIFVPPQFSAQLFEVSPDEAIVRPRAIVIPADETAPDADITFPALDQGSGSNMYGGVEVNWIGEGDEKPETDAKFKDLKLTPHEVAGHIVVTDKLLRNSKAVNAIVTKLFRGAISAAEDDAFLYGDGIARPTGAISSGATIAVNRGTANAIKYQDIVSMLAKAKLGGSLVWSASQSILPQLLTMRDEAGNLIFQPNANNAMSGILMGYPIRFSENSPILGSEGDLVLSDFGYYLIKDGAGIYIQASEHPLFKQNKTIIKAFWNVDGKPWLSQPLTLKNGYEISPFVKLDIPKP